MIESYYRLRIAFIRREIVELDIFFVILAHIFLNNNVLSCRREVVPMKIIHFRMTFDTQAFKVNFSIVGFYSVLVVSLHKVVVETIFYMGTTTFASKILLCAISKGYFLPILDITKNIICIYN